MWLVAELPAGCLATRCRERVLVTPRVETIASAISERLPGTSPRLGLLYDAEEIGGTGGGDLIDLRLDEIRPRFTPCPYLIEVRDPVLPPARSNPQEALWLLLPPGHPVPVSPSARLRITAPPGSPPKMKSGRFSLGPTVPASRTSPPPSTVRWQKCQRQRPPHGHAAGGDHDPRRKHGRRMWQLKPTNGN